MPRKKSRGTAPEGGAEVKRSKQDVNRKIWSAIPKQQYRQQQIPLASRYRRIAGVGLSVLVPVLLLDFAILTTSVRAKEP